MTQFDKTVRVTGVMDYLSQAGLKSPRVYFNSVVTGCETNGCFEDSLASGMFRKVVDSNVGMHNSVL